MPPPSTCPSPYPSPSMRPRAHPEPTLLQQEHTTSTSRMRVYSIKSLNRSAHITGLNEGNKAGQLSFGLIQHAQPMTEADQNCDVQ